MLQHTTTRLLAALAVAVMALVAVGYATAGSLGHIKVQSTPPGARVIVGGQVVGTTPTTLKLPEGNKVRITLKKSGYKTRSLSVTPKANKLTRVKVSLKPK